MALILNGSSNVITGLAVGGLPDGIVDTDMLAANAVTAAKRGAGAILQVVQEVKTNTWSAIVGGSTYSGAVISKAITTSSSSNKVLVFVNVNVGYEGGDDMGFALYRGGSVVSGYTGDAASNRMRVASQTAVGNIYQQEILTGCYLDSPGSAAAHTYDVRLYYRGDSSTDKYLHVNKANSDGDTYDKTRSASSLTLIEVAA